VKQKYGADMENVVFENIFYNNTDNDYATAFDFDTNQELHTLKNVVISRAFLGNCQNIFNMKQKGNVIFRELYGKHIETQNGEVFGTEE
jgi:hypothetical protein